MKVNIKRFILTFFILIVTFVIGAEQKIPNEIILENPQKEVTTVKGLKNRESAEMNIKVKKRNIEEIEGIEIGDRIEFTLPKESLLGNNEIKVMRSIPTEQKIPNASSNTLRRSRRDVLSTAEIPFTIEDSEQAKIIKISSKEGQSENYIIEQARISGEISKIYKGKIRNGARAINLGEVIFKVDKRLTKHRNSWIDAAGRVSETALYPDLDSNYSPMVYISGTFTGSGTDKSVIQSIEGISGRPFKDINGSNNKVKVFRIAGNDRRDESAMMLSTIGSLYGNLQISTYNSENPSMLNNMFTVIAKEGTATPKMYTGNLKEEYLGEDAANGVGTLDLSLLGVGSWVEWNNALGSGDIKSSKGSYNGPFLPNSSAIIKLTKGKLFDRNSATGRAVKHIVSKLVVTSKSGAQSIIEGTYGGKFSTDDSKFPKNRISINDMSGEIVIYKLNDDFTPETYNIKAYYKDIFLGELSLTITNSKEEETVNIGEVEFQIDKRLKNSAVGNWISSNGALLKDLDGSILGSYYNLVNLKGRFKNLVDSTRVLDIVSIEGRGIKMDNTFGNSYNCFITAPGSALDESAMPINVNLNYLTNNLIISKNNSNNAEMLNNRFKLKGSDNIFYLGNIKETYLGEDAAIGEASLDIGTTSIGDWVKWKIDKALSSGELPSSEGSNGELRVMKFSSGKLFNTRSAVDLSSAHVVSKLKVTNRGITDVIQKYSSNPHLETSKFKKNKIGIDSDGGLVIYKLSEEISPEIYEIEIYNDSLLLGKLILTIVNTAQVEIGEVEFQVDKRLQNASKSWIGANGILESSPGIGGTEYYDKLIALKGSFTNLVGTTIADVVSIEGRSYKGGASKGYIGFKTASGVYKDESTMPVNTNLSNLRNDLKISKNNSTNSDLLNNRFTLKGDNGTLYKGNIKEVYLGEDAAEGGGILDLSKLGLGAWTSWNTSGGTGNVPSTGGTSTKMELSSGKLFNWKSATNPTGDHIVTKLKIVNRSVTDEITKANIGQRLETTKFTKNRIGIDSGGGSIFIHKLTEDTTPETYEIEAYHKEILLGKLNLTITNATKSVEIGEVEFQVDKRLQNKSGYWIDTNGNLGQYIGSSGTAYPKLINLKGFFTNLESTTISDVVSIRGRDFKGGLYGKYRVFTTAQNIWVDESAMPVNINLNTLKNHLKISKNNSTNSNLLNNNFTLKGDNGTLYKGNVKEVYSGENAAEAVGTLDLSKLKVGIESTRWSSSGGTGTIPSTGGVPTKMELSSGKLFNWNSAVNPTGDHIVTKLKVVNRGVTEEIIKTNIGERLETTKFTKNAIGLNNGNGYLYIRKLTKDTIPETYEIEAYYNDILLGKLNLTITNKQAFEIIGGDTINFGALIQGNSKKMDANMIIKNLNSKKIVNVELNNQKPIKVMHINNKDVELPIVGEVRSSGQGTEVPVVVSLTANAAANQLSGDYEGELNLYITIE